VKLAQGAAATHLALGNAWAQGGHFELAGLQFALALALAPGNADAQKSLGRVLLIQHKPAEAAEHFRRVLALDERDAEALDGLGEALAMENHVPEALKYFSGALKIKPDDAQIKRHRDQAAEMLKQAATRPVK
jgi:tetratricopeptide (TPR) repeat protein